MRFQRSAKLMAATALAGLSIALLPGAASADEADGLECTESRPLPFNHVTYTCEAESEDIRWRLTGICHFMFGISAVASPVVEGSGSATVSCPIAGPIVHLGEVSLEVL